MANEPDFEQDFGDWFTVVDNEVRQICCDCCLVHDIQLRRQGRKLQMRFLTNKRETARIRRKHMTKLEGYFVKE